VVRIGLASDSCGNTALLARAIDALEAAGADRIFFLGNQFSDVDGALALRRPPERREQDGTTSTVAGPDDDGFLRAVEGELRARADTAAASRLAASVVRVASRRCRELELGAPAKLLEMVGGSLCCLVHDKADLTRDDIANATFFFHGNSEAPALLRFGPRYFVTPGHLRAAAPRDRPATWSVLEVELGRVELVVYGEDGRERERVHEGIAVGSGGRVKVR
jgi:hypothetical protein